MRYILIVPFIFLFNVNTVKSQTSLNKIRANFNDKKISGVNFIDNISFTPAGGSSSEPSPLLKKMKIEGRTESVTRSSDLTAMDAIEKVTSVQVKYGMLMDVAIESLTNLGLYNFIEEWFGTHYRMGGTSKRGIDCSAFTSTLLLGVYSLIVPRTAREQYKSCTHISKEDLLEGDLVFFNTRGGVSHVGVYLSNSHFVHASSSRGVMISSLDDRYFRKRFISGGRVD